MRTAPPFNYNSTLHVARSLYEGVAVTGLSHFTSNCPDHSRRTIPGGIGQGYDGELKHVTSQLMDLAEATPTDKFAWRPSPGVRSTSEVYMHIAVANFYYVSVVRKEKMPAEIKPGFEKSVTAKADVISWLKRSLDAARDARATETPKELERRVEFFQRSTTADAVYLRLIIHCNEHMGQLVAYSRMTGVTPPWSKD
jgi:uncharacterized damage-inducible protein DinB